MEKLKQGVLIQKQGIYTEVAKAIKAIKKDEPYWPKTIVAQAARICRTPNEILHMADLNKYHSMENKQEMVRKAIDSIAYHIRFIENLKEDEAVTESTETTEEIGEDPRLQDQEPETNHSGTQGREDEDQPAAEGSDQGVHRIEPAGVVQQDGAIDGNGSEVLPGQEMGV